MELPYIWLETFLEDPDPWICLIFALIILAIFYRRILIDILQDFTGSTNFCDESDEEESEEEYLLQDEMEERWMDEAEIWTAIFPEEVWELIAIKLSVEDFESMADSSIYLRSVLYQEIMWNDYLPFE